MSNFKERRVIFPPQEVIATLDGRKTQFRRVISDKILKTFQDLNPDIYGNGVPSFETEMGQEVSITDLCPFGQVGDRLCVAETFAARDFWGYLYRADYDPMADAAIKWRPAVAMPRVASRITLEITGIRVERLQDISEEDAIAEGIESAKLPGEETFANRWKDYQSQHIKSELSNPVLSFKSLWDSIRPQNPWDSNPWVWAVEYSRLED